MRLRRSLTTARKVVTSMAWGEGKPIADASQFAVLDAFLPCETT